jgi:hypothetical protein
MDQNVELENHPADQEILNHLWNQKVHYHVRSKLPVNPIVCHFNSARITFLHTCSNIEKLPSRPDARKLFLSLSLVTVA